MTNRDREKALGDSEMYESIKEQVGDDMEELLAASDLLLCSAAMWGHEDKQKLVAIFHMLRGDRELAKGWVLEDKKVVNKSF